MVGRAAALVAHGGGPTAVINASLAGLIDECHSHPEFSVLYGAEYGLHGAVAGNLIDLSRIDRALLPAIAQTPGSAIGSSRKQFSDADCERLLDILRKRDIRYFFYTGGNGSMGTALEIDRFAQDQGYELHVIGIPKTIDNDIAVTDHTPGYGSVARFFAHALRDIGEDNRSLPAPICVVEVLGRNVGWVVAATALARPTGSDDAPHLIYFPERRVSLERIAADTQHVVDRLGRCVIAVCEGQVDDKGQPFGADVDRSGSAVHRLASNLGHTLAQQLSAQLGIRARAEKPGLLGRSCAMLASETDREEAYRCGQAAAVAAVEGKSGVMVALQRQEGPGYAVTTFLTSLESVARKERGFPADWISEQGTDVREEFLEYLRPLAGAVLPYPHLPIRY